MNLVIDTPAVIHAAFFYSEGICDMNILEMITGRKDKTADQEWKAIEKSFAAVDVMEKSRKGQRKADHKYIRVFTGSDGKDRYLYPKDLLNPFKALLSFFNIGEKKIDDTYQKENIERSYGVDKKTFGMHVLEYLTNRKKWDGIFSRKEEREKHKKPVAQEVIEKKAAEKKTAEKNTTESPAVQADRKPEKKVLAINRSLMRKIYSIYNPVPEDRKESEIKPAAEKINEFVGRKTIKKPDGTTVMQWPDGRIIHTDRKGNVTYDNVELIAQLKKKAAPADNASDALDASPTSSLAAPVLAQTEQKPEDNQNARNPFSLDDFSVDTKNLIAETNADDAYISRALALQSQYKGYTDEMLANEIKAKTLASTVTDKEQRLASKMALEMLIAEMRTRNAEKEENESSKDITKINNDFNDDIENFKSGSLNEKYKFKLGKPSEILLKCGFPNDDIELLAKQLKLKMSIHNFSADDIKDLPLALQNPLAVFSYGDAKKSQNVIVNLNKDGKNFVVGIHFNQVNGQISDIRGLFNKDNQEWLNWINQGKARYLNKNKLQELINQQRTNLAEVEYLDLKPVESILQQNPAVNDLFLEDDYIEKMNRHNAMLGNQNAKKDFTEEQQKEYDKTKKWNEDYIAESDQEVKEELLKDQLDAVDNPNKDARTKAKYFAIKDLYEETSGKKYEKKTVKPQTTDEMKKEQKEEKEARKKAGLPNPGNNVGDRVSAIDDADTWNPNSENYRFKDTGYIAGSRKELASMFIMERAKRGERIDAHELDFDGLEENPRAAEKLITKSNIFGEVDWNGLREKGMSGSTAFLIDRIYASAGSKPDESNAQARKQYVIALNGLRDRFEDCKTVPEVIDTLKEIREEIRGEYVEIKEMPEYKKITDKMKSLRETINDKRMELENLAEQCRRKAQAEQQKVVEKYIQKAKDEKLVRWNTRVSSYNIPEKYKLAFNSENSKAWSDAWKPHTKAVEDFKQELISKGAKEEDFFRKNDTYGNGTKTYPINWSDYYTLMPEAQEYGALDSELDAYIKKMKVAVSMKNPLLEAWKSLGKRFTDILYSDSFNQHKYDCTKGTYDNWEWLEKEVKVTEKKTGKEKKKFQLLVANQITRKGGRNFNVTSTQDLKKSFNLRDVQSGNWVLKDPASAEFHVRNAAQAFADLADVTGISDDKISLNGRLAMAFGARGTGGFNGTAAAHYEPVERVINLTKFHGGGSLGHEWFHAFDNMITSAMTGDDSISNTYLTNIYHDMTEANQLLLREYIELQDAEPTYGNVYRINQLARQLEKKSVDLKKIKGEKTALQFKIQTAFDDLVKAMTLGDSDMKMNLTYEGKDYKDMLRNMSDDSLKFYRDRYSVYSGDRKPMQLIIADAGSLDGAVAKINERYENYKDSKSQKNKMDWLKMAAAYYDRQPDGNKNGIPLRVSSGRKVSQFLSDANDLDMNSGKNYWSTTHEMAARAFSAYLYDTLNDMGRQNDYLAYATENKYYEDNPYPEGEERKRINAAFKKLFEVVNEQKAIQKAIDILDGMNTDKPLFLIKGGRFLIRK